MLCKYGKQTRDFWGVSTPCLVYFFYSLGAFLIKQLFHSHLLDMRLVMANSYPTRAYGIIAKYRSFSLSRSKTKKKIENHSVDKVKKL